MTDRICRGRASYLDASKYSLVAGRDNRNIEKLLLSPIQSLNNVEFRWMESYGPDLLADALAELLGEDCCQRLADAISQRVAKG